MKNSSWYSVRKPFKVSKPRKQIYLGNFLILKNKFSCRILTGGVYFHCEDLTFNSLITLLDHITSEGGEFERQQHRAVCRVYWFKRDFIQLYDSETE